MKTHMNKPNLTQRQTAVAAAIALLTVPAYAGSDFAGESKDAWLTGKVETVFLLNTHLNSFEIDTDVDNGIVSLSGSVESDIDRDLAETLAEGVDGVIEVDNQLVLDETAMRKMETADDSEPSRSFGTWVDDATTTAAVKSKLIGNSNIKGLQIDVDTKGDVVTLSGRVNSEQQKSLAAELAGNTGDVRNVRNNLVVDPE